MEQVSKIAPFGVRMPDGLKFWLKESARKNLRSMNSELIVRLEASKRQEEESAKAA